MPPPTTSSASSAGPFPVPPPFPVPHRRQRFSHGIDVLVPSPAGPVPAVEYAPSSRDGPPACALIMCPGSSGGMGPGISKNHRGLGLDKRGSAAAYGSVYTRLAIELSTGEDAPSGWDPPLASKAKEAATPSAPSTPPRRLPGSSTTTTAARSAMRGGGRPLPVTVACLHMTWRRAVNGVKWPGGKLRQVSALADAVDDIVAAAEYMRAKYGPTVRVILAGFSFGGPSVWAAARRLGTDKVCGVVALAGSARGGARFADQQLDTEGGVRALDGVPRLWIHGTKDMNVAPAITRHYWEAAAEPKAAVWVVGSEHMFDVARSAVYGPLKDWVTQTATTEAMRGTGAAAAPYAVDPADLRRMTWLTTGAHLSVIPMHVAVANTSRVARASAGVLPKLGAALDSHKTPLLSQKTAGRRGMPSLTKKAPPPVGLGAGWVDVSAALGEGHVEAAAQVNSLVKPMTLEKLVKNPNAKGYSE